MAITIICLVVCLIVIAVIVVVVAVVVHQVFILLVVAIHCVCALLLLFVMLIATCNIVTKAASHLHHELKLPMKPYLGFVFGTTEPTSNDNE